MTSVDARGDLILLNERDAGLDLPTSVHHVADVSRVWLGPGQIQNGVGIECIVDFKLVSGHRELK